MAIVYAMLHHTAKLSAIYFQTLSPFCRKKERNEMATRCTGPSAIHKNALVALSWAPLPRPVLPLSATKTADSSSPHPPPQNSNVELPRSSTSCSLLSLPLHTGSTSWHQVETQSSPDQPSSAAVSDGYFLASGLLQPTTADTEAKSRTVRSGGENLNVDGEHLFVLTVQSLRQITDTNRRATFHALNSQKGTWSSDTIDIPLLFSQIDSAELVSSQNLSSGGHHHQHHAMSTQNPSANNRHQKVQSQLLLLVSVRIRKAGHRRHFKGDRGVALLDICFSQRQVAVRRLISDFAFSLSQATYILTDRNEVLVCGGFQEFVESNHLVEDDILASTSKPLPPIGSGHAKSDRKQNDGATAAVKRRTKVNEQILLWNLSSDVVESADVQVETGKGEKADNIHQQQSSASAATLLAVPIVVSAGATPIDRSSTTSVSPAPPRLDINDDDSDAQKEKTNSNGFDTRHLAPVQGAPGLFVLSSGLPPEYSTETMFKYDLERRRLVWLGPSSTWVMDLRCPHVHWVQLRTLGRGAASQPISSGLPRLSDAVLTSHDVFYAIDSGASQRHYLAVSPKTKRKRDGLQQQEDVISSMYVFHSCDAPARLVAVVATSERMMRRHAKSLTGQEKEGVNDMIAPIGEKEQQTLNAVRHLLRAEKHQLNGANNNTPKQLSAAQPKHAPKPPQQPPNRHKSSSSVIHRGRVSPLQTQQTEAPSSSKANAVVAAATKRSLELESLLRLLRHSSCRRHTITAALLELLQATTSKTTRQCDEAIKHNFKEDDEEEDDEDEESYDDDHEHLDGGKKRESEELPTELDVSCCWTMEPQELFLMKQALALCPHITSLVVASETIITKHFVDAVMALPNLLDVVIAVPSSLVLGGGDEGPVMVKAPVSRRLRQVLQKHREQAAAHVIELQVAERAKNELAAHEKELAEQEAKRLVLCERLIIVTREEMARHELMWRQALGLHLAAQGFIGAADAAVAAAQQTSCSSGNALAVAVPSQWDLVAWTLMDTANKSMFAAIRRIKNVLEPMDSSTDLVGRTARLELHHLRRVEREVLCKLAAVK